MLYQESSRIIEAVRSKHGSVKNLVHGSQFKNKKPLYALVCQTLKYSQILDQIIGMTKLMKQEKILKSQSLAQVLLYDFLIGRGLQNAGKYKAVILKHKAALKAELARLKVKAKVTKNEDLLPCAVKNQVSLPRYVRVNLVKTSVSDVVKHFRTEGYTQIYLDKQLLSYSRFIEIIGSLEAKQFAQDLHLSDLLVFPATTDLHNHVLYKSGDIILQDKASCLPAHVLSPPPGSHVIDCCAAPGNKTTHLASLMGNKGKIFAFDLDGKRLSTMNVMSLRAGVLCAEMCQKDFLQVQPADPKYGQVQYILVDPSCSGSGIVNRMNMVTDDDQSVSTSRLDKLANFQVSVLKHAMSFPNVKRVVYSTCSVHEEENESVVKQALEYFNGQFVLSEALPGWESRGRGVFQENHLCLRTHPDTDLTNGFFVAHLERQSESNRDAGQVLHNPVTPMKDKAIDGPSDHSEKLKTVNNQRKDTTTVKVMSQKRKGKLENVALLKKRNDKDQEEGVKLERKAGNNLIGKKKKRKKHKDRKVEVVVDGSKDAGSAQSTSLLEHRVESRRGTSLMNRKKKKQKRKKAKKSIVSQN